MVVEEEPPQTIPAWMFFLLLPPTDVFCGLSMEQPGAGLISQNEMLA